MYINVITDNSFIDILWSNEDQEFLIRSTHRCQDGGRGNLDGEWRIMKIHDLDFTIDEIDEGRECFETLKEFLRPKFFVEYERRDGKFRLVVAEKRTHKHLVYKARDIDRLQRFKNWCPEFQWNKEHCSEWHDSELVVKSVIRAWSDGLATIHWGEKYFYLRFVSKVGEVAWSNDFLDHVLLEMQNA